jgi:hypothetical protein
MCLVKVIRDSLRQKKAVFWISTSVTLKPYIAAQAPESLVFYNALTTTDTLIWHDGLRTD